MTRVSLIASLLLAFAACSRDDAAIRLQVGESLRSALSSFPAATVASAELDVVCDNGKTDATTQSVDISGDFFTLDGVIACGAATLTLKLSIDVGDGGPKVLVFQGDGAAVLDPRTTIDVAFSGRLYGEIVLDPTLPTGGTCTLSNGTDPPVSVDIAADPVRVPLPVASYGITCTSSAAPDFNGDAVVVAGVRIDVPVALVPLLSNVQLSGITVDGVALADFSPQKTNYRYVVTYPTTTVTVAATSVQADTLVAVGGTTAQAAGGSFALNLLLGANPVTIVVTSADGASTATYTVDVIRAGPAFTVIQFFGQITIEPAIDPTTSTGPFVVYYPASAQNGQIFTQCDLDCGAATFTINGVTLATDGGSGQFAIDVPDNRLEITTIGADGNPLTYVFIVVRGGVSAITCDVGTLTPSFDPALSSYNLVLPDSVASSCSATADAYVSAPGVILTGAGSSAVINVTTLGGTQVGQYTITANLPLTSTKVFFDQLGDTNHFMAGLATTSSGQTASFDDAQGDPWAVAVQHSGTNDVYFLYGGPNSSILVRTVAADGSMAKRPVVATPSTLADYQTVIGGGGMGLQTMIFHPTLPIIYGWSIDGFVYTASMTAPFLDSPPGIGLPAGQATQFGTTSENPGSIATMGVSGDHAWVAAVAPGTVHPNIMTYAISPSDGSFQGTVQPIDTTSVDVSMAAFSHDGNLLFTSGSDGFDIWLLDYASAVATLGFNTAVTPTRIVAHPSLDVVYVLDGGGVTPYGYDVATGSASPLAELTFAGSPTFLDMGVNPTGDLIWVRRTDSSNCELSFAFVNSDGSLQAGFDGNVDCTEQLFGVAALYGQ